MWGKIEGPCNQMKSCNNNLVLNVFFSCGEERYVDVV